METEGIPIISSRMTPIEEWVGVTGPVRSGNPNIG